VSATRLEEVWKVFTQPSSRLVSWLPLWLSCGALAGVSGGVRVWSLALKSERDDLGRVRCSNIARRPKRQPKRPQKGHSGSHETSREESRVNGHAHGGRYL